MSISPPETRASLILRLQDRADVTAWDEFVAVYSPAVYRAARRVGLQSADADDCVQEVLTAVARSVASWLEREDRGTFRAWLFRIARNKAVDFIVRRRKRLDVSLDRTVERELSERADSADVSHQFDMEYHREVFVWASRIVHRQVSETTWQAFYRTSVLGQEVPMVAKDLGMTRGNVYIARSRVMKRLQQSVKTFERGSDDSM